MNIVCILTDDDLGVGEPWEYIPRCGLCGKFRKVRDTTTTGNEDEVWTVCRWCATPAERAQYGWETP